MLFNSFEYILFFLPAAVLVYFLFARWWSNGAARLWLLCCSLFFYSYWNPQYLPLIAGSILGNYAIATVMSRQAHARRPWLLLGLVFNIGLLGYFKYKDFFLANAYSLMGADYTFERLALPLAISFFSLQQIAFLVDNYEGSARPKSLVDYATFVSFFPQLIAGPIVHHREIMPQLESADNMRVNFDNVAKGIFYFSIGLFKKVVIADTFARFADNGFTQATGLTGLESILAILGYTFQLYFDFGGYMDMAIGAALFFNIDLPINFNSPFKSADIIDFWRRWHITLSNFITTYLYTPLVRAWAPFTMTKSLAAIGLTMLIAGLWHGAAWTFIIFGSIHGAALIVNHLWRRGPVRLPRVPAVALTFTVTAVSLCFFRAPDVATAWTMLKEIFGVNGFLPPEMARAATVLTGGGAQDGNGLPAAVLALDTLKQSALFSGMGVFDIASGMLLTMTSAVWTFALPNSHQMANPFRTTRGRLALCVCCLVISFVFLNSFAEKEFLYFDF